jgi:hypothetical protein
VGKLIVLIAILASGSVFAAPVTWTLTGTFSSSGGSASGTFVYDANTNIYSDVSISTFTPGGAVVAVYDMSSTIVAGAVSNGQPDFLSMNGYDAYDPNHNAAFVSFGFGEALTNAGGTVAVIGYGEDWTEYYNPVSGILGDEPQNGFSGFVTAAAVPLPAAVWLFGSALAALGWLRRKQTIYSR